MALLSLHSLCKVLKEVIPPPAPLPSLLYRVVVWWRSLKDIVASSWQTGQRVANIAYTVIRLLRIPGIYKHFISTVVMGANVIMLGLYEYCSVGA